MDVEYCQISSAVTSLAELREIGFSTSNVKGRKQKSAWAREAAQRLAIRLGPSTLDMVASRHGEARSSSSGAFYAFFKTTVCEKCSVPSSTLDSIASIDVVSPILHTVSLKEVDQFVKVFLSCLLNTFIFEVLNRSKKLCSIEMSLVMFQSWTRQPKRSFLAF